MSREELQERMKRCEETLRESGSKVTYQRMEIFRYLASSSEHPDAESIWEAVRERVPTISVDTVYRTLWLFLDLDLITAVGLSRERTRFDANLKPHYHFVCTKCGATVDFYSEELDAIELPESVKALGEVEGAQMEVRGTCKKCLSEKAEA